MTAMISHAFLQDYWWLIISLLAGLLVFLMFVQGGQSFIFSLPRNEMQRTMIVNSLGRKWEFTFTTLVTFGGAFFASFPLFYATSFGGAYWTKQDMKCLPGGTSVGSIIVGIITSWNGSRLKCPAFQSS